MKLFTLHLKLKHHFGRKTLLKCEIFDILYSDTISRGLFYKSSVCFSLNITFSKYGNL